MTLAAFARLLGVSPKWVLNTFGALDLPLRYSEALARRVAVTRAVHDGVGMPLIEAFRLSARALRAWDGTAATVALDPGGTGDVALTVDVYRLMSAHNARLAELNASYAPPVRGRPRSRRVDALEAAADWGLDLSLVRDNLRKTPQERLRQLDAMRAFSLAAQRVNASR